MNKSFNNHWVGVYLKEFLNSLPVNYEYSVIGSVALLSYTQKIGYEREIHDIDIICQAEDFSQIANKLISLDYEQGTFVDKRMPFYKTLMRLAGSKYYRFRKEGHALELLTTPFNKFGDKICIELYPGLRFLVPESFISETAFQGLSFKAAIPEALYCIYSIGFTTWGRVVKAKNNQVVEDLKNLKKVVDTNLLKEMASKVRVEIGKLSFKLPLMLIS